MNKRAISMAWNEIIYWVIAILVLFVLLFLIFPGIRTGVSNIFSITDSYAAPQLSMKNSYQFTADKIGLASIPAGCSGDASAQYTYDCNPDTVINFNVFVTNNGLKPRIFFGDPIFCTNNCNNPAPITQSPSQCSITPGQSQIQCDGGTFTLGASGTYKFYPGVICMPDSTYGCDNTGMSGPVRSDNPNNWITIKVQNTP